MTPVGRREQIQAMLDSRATAVLGADVNRLLRQLQKAPKVTIGTRVVDTLLMRMDVFEAHAALRCPGTTVDRDGNHAAVDQLTSRTKNDFERFREQKKQPRRPSAASRTIREDFQMAVGFLLLVLHKESESCFKFSFWITRNKRALLPILVAGTYNAL